MQMDNSLHQILRVLLDTFYGIRTEGEALMPSISIPPLEAFNQHVATKHR